MKGVLTKRQRDRKRLREIKNFVNNQHGQEWEEFVKQANKGNEFAEIKQDRQQAAKLLQKIDLDD